jgi:hypothetical protein
MSDNQKLIANLIHSLLQDHQKYPGAMGLQLVRKRGNEIALAFEKGGDVTITIEKVRR